MGSIRAKVLTCKRSNSALMPVKRAGALPPLFCMHGEPVRLAQQLQSDRPVYALNYVYQTDAYDQAPATVEGLARCYIREIQQVHPFGPYRLFGFSAGATIAYEMARQLLSGGFSVEHICLVEPMLNPLNTAKSAKIVLRSLYAEGLSVAGLRQLWRVFTVMAKRRPRAIWQKIRTRWYRVTGRMMPPRLRWVNFLAHIQPGVSKYQYLSLRCPVDFVYRDLGDESIADLRKFWRDAAGPTAVVTVVGDTSEHLDLMSEQSLRDIAAVIDNASGPTGNS